MNLLQDLQPTADDVVKSLVSASMVVKKSDVPLAKSQYYDDKGLEVPGFPPFDGAEADPGSAKKQTQRRRRD